MNYTKLILITNLVLFLIIPKWAIAQELGGPYSPDENTILLMHFDGNLNEEASSVTVNSLGITKSYITSPISGLGNAIYFDNTNSTNNSYITVPYSSELSLTGSWTIELWFYINSWDQSHNNWPELIRLPTIDWDANYFLELSSADARLNYGFNSSDGRKQVYSSQNSITIGKWYHIALINDYDNNTLKLILHDKDYIKLEEQSSTYTVGTTISTGTEDLKIGYGLYSRSWFNGYIDEVRISNVVRDYTIEKDWKTTASDNFLFHYTKPELLTENLINTLEKKFNNLDYIIEQECWNVFLLDRSEKIKVFLYDSDEPLINASAEVRDWDVGYYTEDEIHIQVPLAERQLKYFPNFEKAAISVLARYIMAKKRTSEPSNGLSFGFGLYESGYSPDLNLIRNYLNQNNNTFPDKSTFSTWTKLDEEINVELAYTNTFASIFRSGYFKATVYEGLYNKDIWYQIIRIFFLIDIEDGGMKKFIDEYDFIIYSNSQEEADLSLEALRWYADQYEEAFGVRINHPLLVTMYGSDETYTYTKTGSINEVSGGGEASWHSLLRASPATENLDTELKRVFTKYNGLIGHEFMHNNFAFLAETCPPSWLNEGSAMYGDVEYLQGYKGVNINNMESFHDFFWNTNAMYFPDLDNVFELDGNFGYRMSTAAFTFIKNNFPQETLVQFMKRSDDFSIIGYSDIDEFQRHLYETLYHKYMSTFLFNPKWNLERAYTPGTNYTFNWDGHYINDLTIEYSVDGMNSWNSIAEVSFSSNSYSWTVPNEENCILRFSDKKFPEINFTFQILGNKPTIGKVFNMTFENGAVNNITSGKSGSGKDYVQYVERDGENGNYAKFDGFWNAITVENYPNLNLGEDWTIQGDFLIESTTGVINTKPVLFEKISAGHWAKNYSISFNNNGLNNLRFEYTLENNSTVILDVDAGITENNWYTFYFARSAEKNIVEARVYDQSGNLLSNKIKQINGEGKVFTSAGDLYLGSGDFYHNERCLQGGLDNIIIADTYYNKLMSTSINNAPNVSSISNQTITEGSSFTLVQLDDFVTDSDNEIAELNWSFSGNDELSVAIDGNSVATVSVPNEEWNGSETITFTATDPEGDSDSDDVTFTVTNVNDGPVISGIADQTIDEGGSFTTIQLDSLVTDVDNADSEISWSFNGDDELSIEIDGNRIATIKTPDENWFGSETITFTAKDPSNVSSSKDATFVVSPVNDYPIINGAPELIEFVSDTSFTIDIWELVSDVETDNDLLIYEFNVDSDSILYKFDDGTGILTMSAELNFGGEGEISWSVNDSEVTVLDTIHIAVERAVIIGVDDEMIIPDDYVLHQNYPNPFNPSTMVKYGIPEQSNIRIEVFNMLGQSVGLLDNGSKSAGYYETIWNATNLPSGLYLISLRAEGLNSKKNFSQVKKALLLK
jgi:Concanavalin A-like lectin/glucanases superfamily/Secretion system C-terminal sorting domain/Bacterial Ig domain